MHINELCDDTLLQIFSRLNLYSLRCAGDVCRRWCRLSKRSWLSVKDVTLYQLLKHQRLPKGKQLNKALQWVLKRCGHNLKSLNMADPDPIFRYVKANERTFQIIGHYCGELEELNFTSVLILNDFLHKWTTSIDCSKLKRINLNLSFNHYCPVHDGLSALYKACPQLESIDISNSLNARAQDCGEKWPATLKEVYINNAWALTSYSLWSLVKCCPDLQLFSMCGHQCGMDSGLKFVLSDLKELRVLHLEEYPGDSDLGVQIGQLSNLRELHLSGSSMVNDTVITAIARGCRKLETLDLSVQSGQVECSRHGRLTDQGLLSLAYHLPGLKHLYVERRTCVSDEGIMAVLSNGRIESLALAGSDFITDSTLNALADHCADQLYEVYLTQLNNVNSTAILAMCQSWFLKTSRSHLQLHLDEISFDLEEFLQTFKPISNGNLHEFVLKNEGEDTRRSIQLYCDVLITMYAC